MILVATAAMQPSRNETMCVIADTLGRNAMSAVTTKNVIVLGRSHHLLLRGGVLSPMIANMKLDIPTTSLAAKNHDPVAIRKARMTVLIPYLTPLRNRTQIDRQLRAKWNMFA